MKGDKEYKKAMAILSSLYKKEKYYEGKQKEKQKKYDKYLELLRIAAETGHIEAMYNYGMTYDTTSAMTRHGNPRYSPEECFYWYKKASDAGHAEAHINLSFFYDEGIVVKKDEKKALFLNKRAARLGAKYGRINYLFTLDWMHRQEVGNLAKRYRVQKFFKPRHKFHSKSTW